MRWIASILLVGLCTPSMAQNWTDYLRQGASFDIRNAVKPEVLEGLRHYADRYTLTCNGYDECRKLPMNVSVRVTGSLDEYQVDALANRFSSMSLDCSSLDFYTCRQGFRRGAHLYLSAKNDHYDILQLIRLGFQRDRFTVNCAGIPLVDCRAYAMIGANIVTDSDYSPYRVERMLEAHPEAQRVTVDCRKYEAEHCRHLAVYDGSVLVDGDYKPDHLRGLIGSLHRDASMSLWVEGVPADELGRYAAWGTRFLF